MEHSRQRFNDDFKQEAVKKALSRGTRPLAHIANELGIANCLLYQWVKKFENKTMNQSRNPSSCWSSEQKRKAVSNLETLDEQAFGEYIRREGLHKELVLRWSKMVLDAFDDHSGVGPLFKQNQSLNVEVRELKQEVKKLEKVVVEASALLLLKKKADLHWAAKERT
jgi:transposase